MCLVLLVNASLLLRGFKSALTSDPGQATKNVLVASFDLRQQQMSAAQASRFTETLRDNATLIPGIRSAAGGLGGFALLLAASGIYGVVAFTVSRQRKDLGIRMALGADRTRLLGLVIWQGMKPVSAGAVVGLA